MFIPLFMACATFVISSPLLAIGPNSVCMQMVSAQKGHFSLPDLPYTYSAFEPEIDAETMRIHHQKHHQAYVDNLNKAVAANGTFAKNTLQKLFKRADQLPEAIRINAGGHWNHTFFWSILTPPIEQTAMSEKLKAEIEKNFTNVESFREEFRKIGLAQTGSGWIWLIKSTDNKLKIVTTANQDNPLMNNQQEQGIPIMACDIWEHAYYLKYQNRRSDYIDAFWYVVNWQRVEELLFEEASE